METAKTITKFGDATGENYGISSWPTDDRQIVLFDKRGRTQWSTALAEADDLYGKDFFQFLAVGDQDRVKQLFAKCIIDGSCVDYITDGMHASFRDEGVMYPFHVTLYPIARVIEAAVCAVVRVIPTWNLDEQDLTLLKLAADDHPVKEIAALMHRSESAIEVRIRNLKAKTGKTTLVGVVAEAIRRNLL